MKKQKIFSLFVLMAIFNFAYSQALPKDNEYGSPLRFEESIQAFEQADSTNFPPKGAIVCIGSSSMRGWHKHIHEDLAPLTIIPRGFGGSNMNDALYYADRIVLKYKPRAVVVYEGDNDIAQDISPKQIHTKMQELVAKIHQSLPKCRIYFISIKPCPSRWQMQTKMTEANNLFKQECESNDLLTYIDIVTPMLGKDGKPKPEIFLDDDLHMKREGYYLWRDTVRPVLLKNELRYEN